MPDTDPVFPEANDPSIADVTVSEAKLALGIPALLGKDIALEAADAALAAGKAPLSHTHPQSDVVGLTTALATKADAIHTHPQSDITSLTTVLAGKSDTGHTHPNATTSVAGFISAVNQLKLDSLKFVQTTRIQTDASGNYTWTFSTPFAPGTVPRILAVVESANGVTDVINVQVNGTPTHQQCVIKVNRTQQSAVALLGLTILSVPGSVGAQWVHIAAYTP